jgi:hypothetical protein
MLLVREVTGPSQVAAGDRATYRVARFNVDHPSDAEAGRVNWLVKTEAGTALTNVHHQGPEWTIAIPASWSGLTLFVMPYMRSATRQVSVETRVEDVPGERSIPSGLRVRIDRDDRRYYASINEEPRFYVGTDVSYGPRRGLMNSQNPYGPRYAPEENEATHGFWAYYLLPTIRCESRGAFNCINTYDRARFTYGHMQFAAHTPNENFVRLFRELLALPSAPTYFPDLTLRDGRIHLKSGNSLVQLEDRESSAALQGYLNPDEYRVDQKETEIAARFMDWCARDVQFARTMEGFAFEDQRRKIRLHGRKLPLDGLSDKLCLVILDILHQGRAKYTAINAALNQTDPFDALLSIGLTTYRDRIATLRAGILDLEQKGVVGKRVYSDEAGDFVLGTDA